MNLEDQAIWDQDSAEAVDVGAEIMQASTDDIVSRTRMLENEIKIMKSDLARVVHEHKSSKEQTKDNVDKIKLNKQLPYP